MPLSHPSSELLAAFSAGNLPTSQSICISAHVEQCSECKKILNKMNLVGSEILESQPVIPVSKSLKDSVFAALDTPAVDTPVVEKPSSTKTNKSHGKYPRCLNKLIPSNLTDLKWNQFGSKVKTCRLAVDSSGEKLELIHIKAGASAAAHSHVGEEFTLILEGSFSDEHGIYREGDFIVYNESRPHRPVATNDRDCLCLTVTRNPVHFTGMIWRFFNPVYRKIYSTVA